MPVRTEVLMGTLVTIHVVTPGSEEAIERAFGWFREIEACCTRFDENSELRRLCRRAGEPVQASTILFEAVRFALSVAEDTSGAFDPTVRTLKPEPLEPLEPGYKYVHVETDKQTITLLRPLALDLGAVAKGLAVDAAARELAPLRDFAIDAGGDLYLGGHNEHGAPWSVGIRHPRIDRGLIDSLLVSDKAVCTSGDYERGDHILDPRIGRSPTTCASVTVVAPTAMLADALGTAAFVLGPEAGLALFDRHGVDGLILTSALERYETPGLRRE